MATRAGQHRISTRWWPLVLVAVILAGGFATAASFNGTFRSFVPVTLTSERSGLVMETGAKVKLRGVEVGRVGQISGGAGGAVITLEIDPEQIRYIPANVDAKIDVNTIFGAKFVDLEYPQHPSSRRLVAGTVLHSSNVTTEVNTVFENVVDLLNMVDPLKLNAVLTAVADAVRGKGDRIGQATTDLNEVLTALNAHNDTFRRDVRSVKKLGDTYAAAANDIVAILDGATTTSATIVKHKAPLDSLLLNAVGFSQAGINLLSPSRQNFITGVNALEPTTNLLNMYSPEYACTFEGASWLIDHSDPVFGGDGRTFTVDVALLLGNDPYEFPENLPKVAAKGGPGGKPGCGSLPDATKNFPVRQLVTDTGWGTGLDIRPNPGIGHPCYEQWFQTTRGTPQPPSIRECIPGPAPGPIPYPGAPPYGAPLYGPGGVPLWPGVPPPPPNPALAPAPQGAPR
ncbi:MAG: MCE family protein [Actinomycetota bacterium]|uniref:MCE family protein n=1 Tax=Mycobacterium lentiflavum TaxID=141349 RepID=A0ABY3UTH5_MYCLN|nr:MCE family protein [Mycobacterium lentiflavum]MEE3062425.1 MCE family protein [Actinomycetota bacterium]ULP40349.1 MCE family protein [Mycobacterium lentiflavum]